MTKLDEIFEWVEDLHAQEKSDYINTASPYFLTLLNAARSYAALLKFAPEIGALIKITDTALYEADSTTMIDMALCRQVIKTRPTLKAIYDNLTKFGKDTSHD